MRLPHIPQTPASVLVACLACLLPLVGAVGISDATLLLSPRWLLPLDAWACLLPALCVTCYAGALHRANAHREAHAGLLRTLSIASVEDRQGQPSCTISQSGSLARSWQFRLALVGQIIPGSILAVVTWRFMDLHSPLVTSIHAALAAGVWVGGFFVARSRPNRGRNGRGSRRLTRPRIIQRMNNGYAIAAMGGLFWSAACFLIAMLASHGILLPGLARINGSEAAAALTLQGGGIPNSGSPNLERRHLEGADLQRVRWAGANLAGASLRGADLRGADLSGIQTLREPGSDVACSDLPDEKYNSLDLGGADLTGATLTGADLRCANMAGAILDRANLEDANLMEADLKRVRARSARFSGASLVASQVDDADMSQSIFHGVNFARASLRRVQLVGASVQLASFVESDLTEADLSRADMRGARLIDSVLTNAKLQQTDRRGAVQLRVRLGQAAISRSIEPIAWPDVLCRDYFVDRAACAPLFDFLPQTPVDKRLWKQIGLAHESMLRHIRQHCPEAHMESLMQIEQELELDPAAAGREIIP